MKKFEYGGLSTPLDTMPIRKKFKLPKDALDTPQSNTPTPYYDKTGWHYPNMKNIVQNFKSINTPAVTITNGNKQPSLFPTDLQLTGTSSNPYLWSNPSIDGKPSTVLVNHNAPKRYEVSYLGDTVKIPSNVALIKEAPKNSMPKKIDWNAVGTRATDTANQLAPYASNIINALRSPARVPTPNLDAPVTLQRANYDNDRYSTERGIRGINANADRTLDENTSQSVKQYNLAQKFNQLSSINQAERNQNIDISNKEVMTNAEISAKNNAKLDQYKMGIAERTNAQQREQSANVANAADKYMAIQNEKSKANLDLKRFGIIQKMYNTDGVSGRAYKSLAEAQADPIANRYVQSLKSAGMAEDKIVDVLNSQYSDKKAETAKLLLNQKKYGGSMKYSTGGMMKLFN
jgi:hypothetical protein